MKIKEILTWAEEEIYKGTSSDIPAREAEILLEYILKISREKLYIKLYEEFPSEYLDIYKSAVMERSSGKPLSYITHTKEFMSLPFFVNPSVLIPRPETEILVEEVINIAKNIKNPAILDMGTGSGCIGLTIASYLKESSVYVTD
ncbi:MAG: HemK/PrmC family methyltransferase, partial [Candidatus Eremiobacterota bacterium]